MKTWGGEFGNPSVVQKNTFVELKWKGSLIKANESQFVISQLEINNAETFK